MLLHKILKNMKNIILILLTAFSVGCNDHKEEQADTSNSIEVAEVITDAIENGNKEVDLNPQIAIDFMNAYIENCNKMKDALGIVDWTYASPLTTQHLKIELENIVNTAWEQDPEIGLGFDPFFDAQDYPDEGVELFDFNQETGYITVKGINWESFRLTLKVVRQYGQTLVDGCGIVNIPIEKRAER